MKRFGALFDLDGVLIDSESLYCNFWNHIEELYPTGIPDFAGSLKGTTLETILANYPSPEVRADIAARLEQFQRDMRYEPFPGIGPMLDSLGDAGIPMALVTSSDALKMRELERQLPGFLSRFDCIVNGDMVTRSKPDPEGYRLAARRLGLAPDQCVVVEDSLQGLGAGRAAGGKVIAVATTFPRGVVEPLADLTVDLASTLSPGLIVALWE